MSKVDAIRTKILANEAELALSSNAGDDAILRKCLGYIMLSTVQELVLNVSPYKIYPVSRLWL